MSVEIDLSSANIPGLPNKIEVKNAAEEATLKELVALFKTNNQLLQKMAGQKGQKGSAAPGAGAGAANAANTAANALNQAQTQQAKTANAAAKANAAQATVGQRLGSTLGKVASGAGKLAGGMVGLAGAVITGAQKIEEFAVAMADIAGDFATMGDSVTGAARSLKNIPIVGNLLSRTLGAAAEAADRTYNEYTKLSEIGASFGGSMNQMINAATGAGLTMSQFNQIVRENGTTMMALGGTTEAGAKRFAQLGKQLKQSEIGDQLLRLGVTTEQMNSGMASYLSIVAGTGKLQNMSTQQLAESSGKYLQDLNELAKITGQSVDEKKKEAEALAKDVQFRAAMQKLSAEEQAQMINMINAYPQAHRTAIKDMIATGSITTEEGRKFQALYPQAAANFRSANKDIREGRAISKGAQEQMRNAYIDESKSTMQRNKQLLTYSRDFDQIGAGIIEAQGMQKDAYAKSAAEQRKIAQQGGSTAEQIAKFKQRIAATSNEMTKQLISPQALKALESAFSGLAKIVTGVVGPILQALYRVINTVVSSFGGYLSPIIDAIVEAMKPLAGAFNLIMDAVDSLLGVIGPILTVPFQILGGVIKIAAHVFSGLVEIISAVLSPVFKVLGNVSKFVSDRFADVSDVVNTVLDVFSYFKIGILEVIDKIQAALPKFMGGLSKEEAEARKQLRADQRQDLAEKKATREKEAASRNKSSAAIDDETKKREGINKELKGKEEKNVDFSSPQALLKSYGEATGSMYAKQAADEEKRLLKEKEDKKKLEEDKRKMSVMTEDERAKYLEKQSQATAKQKEADKKVADEKLKATARPTTSEAEQPGFFSKVWNNLFGDSKKSIEEVKKEEKKASAEKIRYTVNGREATKEEYEAQKQKISELGKNFEKVGFNTAGLNKPSTNLDADKTKALKDELAARKVLQDKLALSAGTGVNADGTANDAMKAFMENESKMYEIMDKLSKSQKPADEKTGFVENFKNAITKGPMEMLQNIGSTLSQGPLKGSMDMISNMASSMTAPLSGFTKGWDSFFGDSKKSVDEVKKADKKASEEKIRYTVNGREATKEEYEAQRRGIDAMSKQMGGMLNTSLTKTQGKQESPTEKPSFWNTLFGKTLPKSIEKSQAKIEDTKDTEALPDVLMNTTSAFVEMREKGLKPFTADLVKFKQDMSGEQLLEGFENASEGISSIFSKAFKPSGGFTPPGAPESREARVAARTGSGAAGAAGGGGGGGGGGGAAGVGRPTAPGGGGGGAISGGAASAEGKIPSVSDKQSKPPPSDQQATGDVGQFVRNPSGANLNDLEGGTKKRLAALAQEYMTATGQKLQINTAFRSYDEQMELYKKYGSPRAAKPGRSKHEVGLAFDMNSSDAAKAIQLGLFSKYGFHRPVAGETWHIEPVEARGGAPDNPVAPGQEVMVANAGKPVTPDSGKLKAEKGGILSGPKSGYDAELHGTEAVVPLPDGKSIPVSGMNNQDQKAMVELLTSLNSKMDQLVYLNSMLTDINDRQLKVQKNMGHPDLLLGG